ncbi:MAG: hypothetical protein ACHQJ6_02030 [Candidatus Berkiellales bacterium]
MRMLTNNECHFIAGGDGAEGAAAAVVSTEPSATSFSIGHLLSDQVTMATTLGVAGALLGGFGSMFKYGVGSSIPGALCGWIIGATAIPLSNGFVRGMYAGMNGIVNRIKF